MKWKFPPCMNHILIGRHVLLLTNVVTELSWEGCQGVLLLATTNTVFLFVFCHTGICTTVFFLPFYTLVNNIYRSPIPCEKTTQIAADCGSGLGSLPRLASIQSGHGQILGSLPRVASIQSAHGQIQSSLLPSGY